ncbi:MAG: sulfatase [Planctomycetes bacterium]|nr:sulfatase [Planctomycetota bacterium]
MNTITRLGIPVYIGVVAALSAEQAAAVAADRPNVLFIAVDDLRPDLGCYGNTEVKSPNIDKLAAGGTTFLRAYCQQAVCSPSRTSLLLGRRPDTTRIYDLNTHFRLNLPDVVTLPEQFKKNGYHTQGLSKIYHGGLDDPQSWSVPHWEPKTPAYISPEINARLEAKRAQIRAEGKPEGRAVLERDPKTALVLRTTGPRNRVNGPAWEAPDVADNAFNDGQTADRAVEALRQIKDKSFFLAVGFHKPHLPFVAPKRYYDLYLLPALRLATNGYPPKDAPDAAMSNWGELRAYEGMAGSGPLSEQQNRELVRGYRATTSYVDAQIGRVLDELERLDLTDRTIVVLWGDHGWHLGEHGLWCKHTNFEVATRSPLILRAPKGAAGVKTNTLVEFVDIYPTLCELCGIPLPQGLEGTSMAPLLRQPDQTWKPAAFSQFPRPGNIMGYSMRTDRYRYTEWVQHEKGEPRGDFASGASPDAKFVGVELYDHKADPDENVNLANQPDAKATTAELAKMLHGGWKAAVPR